MMWLNSIISALTGALISGAVISSIFNWQLNQRRLQLQTTFKLHREWNGESLRLSRNLGDKFLLAHPNKDLIQIDTDGSVNPEDSVHLWIIIGLILPNLELKVN